MTKQLEKKSLNQQFWIKKENHNQESKITRSMCLDTILPNQTAVDLPRAEK